MRHQCPLSGTTALVREQAWKGAFTSGPSFKGPTAVGQQIAHLLLQEVSVLREPVWQSTYGRCAVRLYRAKHSESV